MSRAGISLVWCRALAARSSVSGCWWRTDSIETQPGLPRGLIMLGVTAAIFMIIGWLAVPGVVTGIDDPQLAPWYVNAGLLNWMGTYLLYPAWCLWLSRRYGG